MKFETINNQLCRMVEPTPLQLDTPMPGNDVHTIRLVELDPNTAELVKALLKAQEKK